MSQQAQAREDKMQAREDKMMVMLQMIVNSQKHPLPYVVQPGSMITSPLTSLNNGNNSSNKRIRNDLSGNDISQQLTPTAMNFKEEQSVENNDVNLQELQRIDHQRQVWQQQ